MAERKTTHQRGYGAKHQAKRKQYERMGVVGMQCARCGKPIAEGQAWDLGHNEARDGWTGPEHASCNRAAGARSWRRKRANTYRPSRDW